jgi:hypothetical protein
MQNARLLALTVKDRSWAAVARLLDRSQTDCRYFYAFMERPFAQPGNKGSKDADSLWTADMVH